MPRRRRTSGAGTRARRQAGLGAHDAFVSPLVTPQPVVEDARDTVYTLLAGASLEGQPTGIVEGARDETYNLLNGKIPEVA